MLGLVSRPQWTRPTRDRADSPSRTLLPDLGFELRDRIDLQGGAPDMISQGNNYDCEKPFHKHQSKHRKICILPPSKVVQLYAGSKSHKVHVRTYTCAKLSSAYCVILRSILDCTTRKLRNRVTMPYRESPSSIPVHLFSDISAYSNTQMDDISIQVVCKGSTLLFHLRSRLIQTPPVRWVTLNW